MLVRALNICLISLSIIWVTSPAQAVEQRFLGEDTSEADAIKRVARQNLPSDTLISICESLVSTRKVSADVRKLRAFLNGRTCSEFVTAQINPVVQDYQQRKQAELATSFTRQKKITAATPPAYLNDADTEATIAAAAVTHALSANDLLMLCRQILGSGSAIAEADKGRLLNLLAGQSCETFVQLRVAPEITKLTSRQIDGGTLSKGRKKTFIE